MEINENPVEIPHILSRLIKSIMRAFYDLEYAIVVDILMRKPGINEEDLLKILSFERKQVRSILASLKSEKIIKVQIKVETEGDNDKTTKLFYYCINYITFINVIKYKLEHIRKRIEIDERDSTNRANFTCLNCHSKFNDLEIDKLFNADTGLLTCNLCLENIEEEYDTNSIQCGRQKMIDFNKQIEPIYCLLRQVEVLKLSPDLDHFIPKSYSSKTTNEIIRNERDCTDIWNRPSSFYNSNQINVSIEDCIDDSNIDDYMSSWIRDENEITTIIGVPSRRNVFSKSQKLRDEILNLLLIHENKQSDSKTFNKCWHPLKHLKHIRKTTFTNNRIKNDFCICDDDGVDDSSSETETSEDESPIDQINFLRTAAQCAEMEIDEFELNLYQSINSGNTNVFVTVNGEKVNYYDVGENIIENMTEEEQLEFVQAGQNLYKNFMIE